MKKISITKEDLIEALTEALGDRSAASRVAGQIEQKAKNENEAEKKAKGKDKEDTKLFCLVINNGDIPANLSEIATAAMVQVPVRLPAGEFSGKVDTAIRSYNDSEKAKKKKVRVESVGRALSEVPRKYWKDQEIAVKTKEPVQIILIRNQG